MNRNEPRIPREVQVRLDEDDAQFHRSLKSGHRIFGGVSGRASMRNHPGFSHEVAIVAEAGS
jgi:hypothetical protein